MKRINVLIYATVMLQLFTSCEKNEMKVYHEKPAIYFSELTEEDSVVFSFAGRPSDTDTVFLNLKLLGNKLETDKRYVVRVDQDQTTAQESLHYKKLEDDYVFPANAFEAKFPLIVYNKDEALEERPVRIVLKLVGTDGLDEGYPDQTEASVILSNQLTKPSYWDMLLVIYYGPYSRVKHDICIGLQGHDFPATLPEFIAPPYSIGYWMSQGRIAAKYFSENTVYDENGNQILTWSPF